MKFIYIFAFAALFSCAIAGTSKFTPAHQDCVISFTSSKPSQTETYIGYETDTGIVFEAASDDGELSIFRCDLLDDDGKCYTMYSGEGSCNVRYKDMDYVRESLEEALPSITYDDTKYPVDTDCADASQTGCKKYCDAEHDDSCIYVDANNFIFKKQNGDSFRTIVYSDSFDPLAFTSRDCKGTYLPPPANPCVGTKTFVPHLDCATHFELSPDDKNVENVYLYVDEKAPIIKMVHPEGDFLLIRGDLHDDDGKVFSHSTTDECQDKYITLDEASSAIGFFILAVQYDDDGSYPRACACPKDIQGECKMYCDAHFSCVIVDDKDRMVGLNETGVEKYRIKYSDEAFEPSVFALTTCAGEEAPAPSNPCIPPPQPSSPSSTPTPTPSSTSPVPSSASFIEVAFSVVLAATVIAALL